MSKNSPTVPPSISTKRRLLYRITLSAVFLSVALVIKTFTTFNIPIFGAGGMKVGFSGVFTAFPAFLFGPVYGGCVSALADLLGFLIKPDGAYIPWLTLTAFLGGFIKGLAWRLITAERTVKKSNRITTAAVSALLAILCITGIAFHASLNGDWVLNGLIANQNDLPTRGKIQQLELSPLSKFVCNLAMYNNDVITLSAVQGSGGENEAIFVPAYVEIDGYKSKITKIGAKAFSECKNVLVYIPATVTSIDEAAFEGVSDLKIHAVSDTAADKFAVERGVKDETLDILSAKNPEEKTITVSSDTYSADGFTLKSSDTYRKYLAGYINFVTVGLELTAVLGFAYLGVTQILVHRRQKQQLTVKNNHFAKIFISIFAAGIIVTTINTQILRVFLAAWNNRAFMILWIPRAAEELIICMIQAYIISVLYTIFIEKIAPKLKY